MKQARSRSSRGWHFTGVTDMAITGDHLFSETLGNHQFNSLHLNLPSLIKVILIVAKKNRHVFHTARNRNKTFARGVLCELGVSCA